MSKHLGPLKREMSDALSDPSDLVRHALILYRAIYSVLRDLKPRRPTWKYVTHEWLMDDSIKGYAELFAHLGVEMPDAAVEELRRQQQLPPRKDEDVRPLDLNRNLDQNKNSWKGRLTDAEIERVLEATKDLVAFYYPDAPTVSVPAAKAGAAPATSPK